MTVSRLARGLALDGNPLRRRTDKIAVCLTALLGVVFVLGAPVVSVAAIGAAGRMAAGPQVTRSWRQVPAVVQTAAPAPPAWELSGYSWVRARWVAPDGRVRAGAIPVGTAAAVGQRVWVWVDAAGTPTGPPPNPGAVVADQAAAALAAVVMLGVAVLCLLCAGRWALDRRRLVNWETEWAAVGPQWTRRFQSSD